MFEIALKLRQILKERGLSQTRLAELAGLPPETVNRIVKGTTKNPTVDTMARIAAALNVTVGWFLGEKGFDFTPDRRRKLREFMTWGEELLYASTPDDSELQAPNASAVTIGRKPPQRVHRRGEVIPVSATDWRESFGDRREEVEIKIPEEFAKQGATMIFRAEGKSMIGEHISDGDLLYVVEEPEPRRALGRIVVCVVAGSAYVKRLEPAEGRIRLVSANDRFPPMVFDENHVEWNLVGIVVGWSHKTRR